jgi:hypothetical protein
LGDELDGEPAKGSPGTNGGKDIAGDCAHKIESRYGLAVRRRCGNFALDPYITGAQFVQLTQCTILEIENEK